MAKIVISVPGPDAPGYLRRMRRLAAFAKAAQDEAMSPEMVDNLVEFLLDFVTEPEDRDEAREALYDLSQKEFEGILAQIIGAMTPEVPTKNAAP